MRGSRVENPKPEAVFCAGDAGVQIIVDAVEHPSDRIEIEKCGVRER